MLKTLNKIIISVPGKFHAVQLIEDIYSDDCEYLVLSSSPRLINDLKVFKYKNLRTRLILKPSQVIAKIFKIKIPKIIKYFDSLFFDFVVSLHITKKYDVFYGFAGNSLISGKKAKKNNVTFILDRACPHVLFQEKLLKQEGKISGYTFIPNIKISINRSINEYYVSDHIVIPSSYTYKSFKKYDLHEKTIFFPLRHNQNPHKNFKILKKPVINEPIVFGLLGGNPLRKGIYYLINAWDSFRNNNNSKLILKIRKDILYESKEVKEIIRRNKSIVIDDTYYDDIYQFYRKIDIFCLTSVDDGFGMVLAEAAQSSKPIIVSNHSGSSDLIKNDFNGFVYTYNDYRKLSKLFSIYTSNPELIHKHGAESHASYMKYLDNRVQFITNLKSIIE